MLDIGWSELLVIGIVALVVIGPKELPRVLRSVGQMVSKLRRMAGEFQGQFQEALREAELADLHKDITGLKDDAQRTIAGVMPTNPLLDVKNDIETEVKAARDAIEGRTHHEPETRVEDDVAEASGLDPVSAEARKAAEAASDEAVQAQLPIPEPAPPLEPYAFEEIVPAATPSLRPVEPVKPAEVAKAPTVPVEAAPLPAAAKAAPAASATPTPDASAEPAKPKRKPRVVTAEAAAPKPAPNRKTPAAPLSPPAPEPEVSEAVADLDDATPAPKASAKPAPKSRAKAKPAVRPADDGTPT